jgi:4-nitrophenyl phosphatase
VSAPVNTIPTADVVAGPVRQPAGPGLAPGKRLLIFDLDGVVYRGNQLTPGARDVLASLRNRGFALRFLTNNSSMSRESYREKLGRLEIHSEAAEIMTSARATALYMKSEGLTTALVVGEIGLIEELAIEGIAAVHAGDRVSDKNAAGDDSNLKSHPDAVIVGIDRSFTYPVLCDAQQTILAGARFIATNGDPTFPTESGDLPGGGSIVAAIATASGRTPFIVGKPNTFSLELLLAAAGVSRGEAILVGDRLDTDIDVGRRAGLETVLTLTGVTTIQEAERAPAEQTPTAIIRDLQELEALLGPAA